MAAAALAGYWTTPSTIPDGAASPAITYEWYRDVPADPPRQRHATAGSPGSSRSVRWRSASGLILGVLTGFAAFFGALMNMSFLLAGSASTNPVMFTLADRPDPRLEGRRLLRRRPLPPPDARHAVASGPAQAAPRVDTDRDRRPMT